MEWLTAIRKAIAYIEDGMIVSVAKKQMRIITVRSGFLSEESVTHNINVNPPLPNGGTLSSFFKKALYRFIKDLCQAPQLNIGYCSCLILDSRNGATADIDSNGFKLF